MHLGWLLEQGHLSPDALFSEPRIYYPVNRDSSWTHSHRSVRVSVDYSVYASTQPIDCINDYNHYPVSHCRWTDFKAGSDTGGQSEVNSDITSRKSPVCKPSMTPMEPQPFSQVLFEWIAFSDCCSISIINPPKLQSSMLTPDQGRRHSRRTKWWAR